MTGARTTRRRERAVFVSDSTACGTDVGERLADGEPTSVEIDVGPREAESFSTTKPSSEQQCPERGEAVVGSMT